jgi:hypothetical protein
MLARHSLARTGFCLRGTVAAADNAREGVFMSFLDLLRGKKTPKIFICYRRYGEGSGYGGRVADKLVKHFGAGQCFRDVENIETGVDFVDSINKAISACEVLVVVIGPDWATLPGADDRPRIADPKDFVRLEVAAALKRAIRVMPLLVGGATIPDERVLPEDLQALSRRHAHELTDSRWDYDTDRLIEAIESIGIRGKSPAEQAALQQRFRIGAAVLATAGIGLLAFWLQERLGSPEETAGRPQPQEQADPLQQPTAPPQQQVQPRPDEPERRPLEAELRAEQERNRALQAERDRALLEAELQAERAKRVQAEAARRSAEEEARRAAEEEARRSAQAAASDPVDAVQRRGAESPSVAGIWVDSDNPANRTEFVQDGSRFEFLRRGVLPNGIRFEALGEGTVDSGRVSSNYDATYQTGAFSQGECAGILSPDGTRANLDCGDTLLGSFSVTLIRR